MYAKVVGGDLHEGGGSTIYSFIFERGWLKGNSVQRHGGGLLEEGGRFTRASTVYTEPLCN